MKLISTFLDYSTMFLMVVAKASDMAKRRLSANEDRNGPTSVKTKGCLQLSPEVAMLT